MADQYNFSENPNVTLSLSHVTSMHGRAVPMVVVRDAVTNKVLFNAKIADVLISLKNAGVNITNAASFLEDLVLKHGFAS